MKKILIATIPFALFCILLPGCKSKNQKDKLSLAKPGDSTSQYSGVHTSAGEYSISTPAGWEKKDTVVNGTKLTTLKSPPEYAGDNFRENITIVSEDARGNDYKAYTDANRKTMEAELQGIKILTEEDITIGDLPAKALVYTFTYSTYALKNTAYFTVKNNMGYVITCTAMENKFDKFQPEFKTAVNSFLVKN